MFLKESYADNSAIINNTILLIFVFIKVSEEYLILMEYIIMLVIIRKKMTLSGFI